MTDLYVGCATHLISTSSTSYLTFHAEDGKAILTIHRDGRVEWFGDQSEVALRFWEIVKQCTPTLDETRTAMQALRLPIHAADVCEREKTSANQMLDACLKLVS